MIPNSFNYGILSPANIFISKSEFVGAIVKKNNNGKNNINAVIFLCYAVKYAYWNNNNVRFIKELRQPKINFLSKKNWLMRCKSHSETFPKLTDCW